MKKNYITPAVEIQPLVSQELLNTVSGVISEKGMKYGGVDETGEKDPSAKYRGSTIPEEEAMEQNPWENGLW